MDLCLFTIWFEIFSLIYLPSKLMLAHELLDSHEDRVTLLPSLYKFLKYNLLINKTIISNICNICLLLFVSSKNKELI